MLTALKCAVSVFDLPKLQKKVSWLEEELAKEEVYSNIVLSTKYNKELKYAKEELEKVQNLQNDLEFLQLCLLEEQDQEGMEEEFSTMVTELSKKVDDLYVESLLGGKYDQNNAILKLHSGAGGTESCDWVAMVYRMYRMYCSKHDFSLSVIDEQDGEETGYKSVTFKVSGENAYGYLKGEHGVHRLVRISPFDANKRRHTSFLSVEVMPEIENDDEIVIEDKDIRIDTYRASGAGGQHINKTDSAIRITHFPTGIVVTCQNERSQIKNKEMAFHVLKSKLLALKWEEEQKEAAQLKGEERKIEWGSQIRSYVFCPYTLVKDHRTKYETSNIQAVMDGQLDKFIAAYLKMFSK